MTKTSVKDNKFQDQFQQGLIGLSYSIVKGHFDQVFHCLPWEEGKRTSHKSALTGEKPLSWSWAPSMPWKVSILSLLCIWIHLLGLSDHSRWDVSTLAAHEKHLRSFKNMLRLRPYLKKVEESFLKWKGFSWGWPPCKLIEIEIMGQRKNVPSLPWESPGFAQISMAGYMTQNTS